MKEWTPEKGPWSSIYKIWRWEVVSGLCLMNGYRYGAELGVDSGRFTLFMLAMIPQSRIIAVDLWAPQPDNKGPETWAETKHEKHYERFKRACAEHYPGRVDIVRDWTHNAAKNVADGALDFAFIDADHSYEGCSRDIADWTPKIRKGGMICGHDYNWDGVKRAVDETGPCMALPDSVWARYIK